jgi:hypothetical protein
VWGLDLVGPLQKAPGGFSHLLVAIDKFSKWIKVRPLTSIRSEQAVAFFTNIIHRFRVPNSIITDMAPSSLAESSWTSARTTTSGWTSHLGSPHDKWAGGACQPHDFCRDLSRGSTTTSTSSASGG